MGISISYMSEYIKLNFLCDNNLFNIKKILCIEGCDL